MVLGCGDVSDPTVDGDRLHPVCNDADGVGCEYPFEAYVAGHLDGESVTDVANGRTNPITIRYPIGATGPRPVILWSHGGGLGDGGDLLSREWGDGFAEAGWVVIHVAHTNVTGAQVRSMCRFAHVPDPECTAGALQAEVLARPRDLIAILDDLPRLATVVHDRTGVDLAPERVIVAGWSAGSQGPLVLAGAMRAITPTLTHFQMPDPRPMAVIAISPQGPGFSGFFENGADTSWSQITRPVLVMTGDNDIKEVNPDLLGTIRRRAWDNLPGGNGDQHLLYSHIPAGIGEHGTYNLGDQGSDDPALVRLSAALLSTARAFVDAVDGSTTAADYLGTQLPRRLAGDAEWSTK